MSDSGDNQLGPDDPKLIRHLLQTDPTAFERLIRHQLRRRYQQADEPSRQGEGW